MRLAWRLRLVLAMAVIAIGCGDDDSPGRDDGGGEDDGGGGPVIDGAPVLCIDGLQAIALTPADSTVTLDGGPAADITFTATGQLAGGSQELDAARLTWTATRADDTPPGTIAAGVLSPNPDAGGVVTVTASDGCVTGSTTVTFVLDATIGTPVDPDDWSEPPTTAGTVPLVVYPSDQTRFPRNIYRTLFQWRSQGYAEFRLTFAGPGGTVTVFTDGVHPLCAEANPAAGCWEADEAAWTRIAGSNAGATATWTVDALDRSTVPPTVRRAAPIELGFSRRDVTGAIFYWSTTSAGVRRANVADEFPEDYITGKPGTVYDEQGQVKCVACHVVSRDGKYMAAPVQAESGNGLWILGVTLDAPPDPLVTEIQDTGGHGFASISPDDTYVVAAWGGVMWLLERATGNYIEDLPLGELEATHPDWDPDGSRLVFATGKGDAPGEAGLSLIDYSAGVWGTPSQLVAAEGDRTNLFPMFSPEGDWIAFSRGKGGHGDAEAQLWLVDSGGGDPLELGQANRVVSNQLTDGEHQNSQPTWAPPGDLDWIAFNSQREYGVVLQEGTQQIWVAAVDRGKAADGVDPSYPAFRLQFQGLEENNHRAYWTLDVRNPTDTPDAGPPVDSGLCVAAGQPCDPVTSTCCDDGYICDTADDGLTYVCLMPDIP